MGVDHSLELPDLAFLLDVLFALGVAFGAKPDHVVLDDVELGLLVCDESVLHSLAG